MVMLSAALLCYSFVLVPLQLSFWNSNDVCWRSPTLQMDMFVDAFFAVAPLLHVARSSSSAVTLNWMYFSAFLFEPLVTPSRIVMCNFMCELILPAQCFRSKDR